MKFIGSVILVALFFIGALIAVSYIYENTWHTPEGWFFPMALTVQEEGRCFVEPETTVFDEHGDSYVQKETEMCDRVTVFSDDTGTIRALIVMEYSSVTDNTYYVEWKVVADESACMAGEYCIARGSSLVKNKLKTFEELRAARLRGEGTDF